MFSESLKNPKPIILWLKIVIFMVFAMVFIGGVTRLTDSGLSMVEWKPIVGAIPPMSHTEWEEAFSKYKAYPEFKKVNFNMSLSEFKTIFFWEYFHRLWGRLIGLVFFIPMLFFTFKKLLPKPLFKKLFLAFILGGSQGLLGWYMVQSGLVDRPDVSHFRLCAHFMLALIIMGYISFLILQINHPNRTYSLEKNKVSSFIFIFFTFLVLQIIYGTFVAGLDAGLTHNTFPKMGRYWLPIEVNLSNIFSTQVFNNVVLVQFMHRAFAYILFMLAIFGLYKATQIKDYKLKRGVQLLSILVLIQFVLGVSTLLSLVSLSLASAHQVMAVLLFLTCIRCLFFSMTRSV